MNAYAFWKSNGINYMKSQPFMPSKITPMESVEGDCRHRVFESVTPLLHAAHMFIRVSKRLRDAREDMPYLGFDDIPHNVNYSMKIMIEQSQFWHVFELLNKTMKCVDYKETEVLYTGLKPYVRFNMLSSGTRNISCIMYVPSEKFPVSVACLGSFSGEPYKLGDNLGFREDDARLTVVRVCRKAVLVVLS